MPVKWLDDAWYDYLSLLKKDKNAIKKINLLVTEIMRHPYTGTGHPEPLMYVGQGYWSRRIDQKNRLVYYLDDEGTPCIVACTGLYDSI